MMYVCFDTEVVEAVGVHQLRALKQRAFVEPEQQQLLTELAVVVAAVVVSPPPVDVAADDVAQL